MCSFLLKHPLYRGVQTQCISSQRKNQVLEYIIYMPRFVLEIFYFKERKRRQKSYEYVSL